jgi:hypothetical protein
MRPRRLDEAGAVADVVAPVLFNWPVGNTRRYQ